MGLTPDQRGSLLATLEERFAQNMHRHPVQSWSEVRAKLSEDVLGRLEAMEATGGEPDVVDLESGSLLFVDCAAESPSGRRSLCYDPAARDARKEAKPAGSAVGMAAELGVELLDEAQYRALQAFGTFDAKTSSWLRTPDEVRQRGGAIFGDWRYGRVFVYHNGVQSYYASRGFRGLVRL